MTKTVLDEEERGARTSEGRGVRRDEEEGAARRVKKKVVKKLKLKKWLEDASLTPAVLFISKSDDRSMIINNSMKNVTTDQLYNR